MSDQLVTEWAKEQARELARKAAKEDDWLEPVMDDRDQVKATYYDPSNWDDFQQKHRCNWSETEHYNYRYDLPLSILTGSQQVKEDDPDVWYEAYRELTDIFWDEWEEAVGLRKFWKESLKEEGAQA